MAKPSKPALAQWFEPWHPRYRAVLMRLGVIGAVLGGVAYGENAALQAFGDAFATLNPSATRAPHDPLLGFVERLTKLTGAGLVVAVLGAFALVRVVRIVAEVLQRRETGTLQNRARADLEAEILSHLLQKEDAFFVSRPPGEIMNRLGGDIGRVIDARLQASQQRQSALLILGNLVFFARQDWRLAVAAAGFCAASAWLLNRLTKPVKQMDRAYMSKDDAVKSCFEDLLRASPEVQVSDLGRAVRAAFEKMQEERRKIYMRFVDLNSRIGVGTSTAYLLALSSLCILPVYFATSSAPDARVALVPVILKALPELFSNASSLVMQRLSAQLADTSKARLMEYDSGLSQTAAAAPPRTESTPEVRMEHVTYQYTTPSGNLQGGVVDVSVTLRPNRSVAIIGAAGSGKSTLTQILLGRVTPLRGRVLIGARSLPDMSPPERASYLSFMPQTVTMLDASIGENLLLGTPRELRDGELELIERLGVAAICRTRALGLLPQDSDLDRAFGRRLVELRSDVRKLVEAVAPFQSFTEGGCDSRDWVLEALLGGRCDRDAALGRLFAPAARPALQSWMRSSLRDEASRLTTTLLAEGRPLLTLASYQQYSRLAVSPVEERLWQLRASMVDAKSLPGNDRAVAFLTMSVGELPSREALELLRASAANEPELLQSLRRLLGDAFKPLLDAEVHPFLTWKQNLLFGSFEARNSRIEQQIEQQILELLQSRGLNADLLRLGLRFKVGRGGSRLSGGQRQLVSLARTLLRGTPIVVLDEPTSALDPANRERVAAVLAEHKQGRVIVMVSHDMDFVRHADDEVKLDGGRLVQTGRSTPSTPPPTQPATAEVPA